MKLPELLVQEKVVSEAEYAAVAATKAEQDTVPSTPTPILDWYKLLAPVITAAAEGKVVQYLAADGNWYNGFGAFISPNKYRIKPEEPKTVKVSGFDVPEPMREVLPKSTRYYVPSAATENWYHSYEWDGEDFDVRILQRGAMHITKEAAVAHAKAMLGIDPYADAGADDEHS